MNTSSLGAVVVGLLSLGVAHKAHAGCGDTTAARIDWVEELDVESSTREVKLHGAFAWEASPDGWSTHPVAGNVLGYVHFGCSARDASCQQTLAGFAATAGRKEPIYFHGINSSSTPAYIHAEGEVSIALTGPAWPDGPTLSGGALNAQLWPTVVALPLNEKGKPPLTMPPVPARGCSSAFGLLAFLAGPVLFALTRRRKSSGDIR